jgi:hypothetical protein
MDSTSDKNEMETLVPVEREEGEKTILPPVSELLSASREHQSISSVGQELPCTFSLRGNLTEIVTRPVTYLRPPRPGRGRGVARQDGIKYNREENNIFLMMQRADPLAAQLPNTPPSTEKKDNVEEALETAGQEDEDTVWKNAELDLATLAIEYHKPKDEETK